MALVLDGNGTMTVGNGDITGLTAGALEATAIGAGAVRQIVHASTSTNTTTTSSSLVDSGLSASITPTSSSSRILIMFDIQAQFPSGGMGFGIYRDSTLIYSDSTSYAIYWAGIAGTGRNRLPFTYLDSPSTTSSISYKLYMKSYTGTSGICNDGNYSRVTLLEIA